MLSQHAKDGTVMFGFEYGRFAYAIVFMTGPAFAELTYFEKTYGEPSNKYSHPEKGTAESYWRFSDGGEAHAEESKSKSGKFTITFMIHASDSALRPGPLAQTPTLPSSTAGHSVRAGKSSRRQAVGCVGPARTPLKHAKTLLLANSQLWPDRRWVHKDQFHLRAGPLNPG